MTRHGAPEGPASVRTATLLGVAAAPPSPNARSTLPARGDVVVDAWAVPAPFLAPGAMIAGRYRLEERRARGGMGSIWSAVDTALDRRVAVKFLAVDLADDAVVRDRFDRESRAVAMLRTPHVATVYDHGVEQGLPFIVMELLAGEDLQCRLAEVRQLDLPTTARIVSQVARALRQAHAAGIVHRDLKPENVFLARSDDDPSGELVKVLDFGVAKVMDGPRATAVGILVGSPHYMSPEQMRGASDVDARADVWALGVLVYVMLTGHRPFEGSMSELTRRITTVTMLPATTLEPTLPRAIDELFARAMAVRREDRFATATELAEALERIAAASIATPAVRDSLDTPRVEMELSASTRPSQRPTLLGVEPVARDMMPTPVQLAAPSLDPRSLHGDGGPPSSRSHLAAPFGFTAPFGGAPPSVTVRGPLEAEVPARPTRWLRLIAGLAGVFLLLLVVALLDW